MHRSALCRRTRGFWHFTKSFLAKKTQPNTNLEDVVTGWLRRCHCGNKGAGLLRGRCPSPALPCVRQAADRRCRCAFQHFRFLFDIEPTSFLSLSLSATEPVGSQTDDDGDADHRRAEWSGSGQQTALPRQRQWQWPSTITAQASSSSSSFCCRCHCCCRRRPACRPIPSRITDRACNRDPPTPSIETRRLLFRCDPISTRLMCTQLDDRCVARSANRRAPDDMV